jgi:hypothetical protein
LRWSTPKFGDPCAHYLRKSGQQITDFSSDESIIGSPSALSASGECAEKALLTLRFGCAAVSCREALSAVSVRHERQGVADALR